MPRRFAPRQHLSISLNVKLGGVFWTKFEHFLSKTPNKEASPAVARKPRHPAKKFSSHFLICARRFFSSKRKRKLFCWVLLLTSRTAGLSTIWFRKEKAEFPPNPPSAFSFLKRNGNGSRRAKIPSPQPPSFLPACLGFAPKTFRRDGGTMKLNSFPKFQNASGLILSQCSIKSWLRLCSHFYLYVRLCLLGRNYEKIHWLAYTPCQRPQC